MKDEFIDEARKCPQCGVVTYCERCPICGKKLARTAKGVLKFRNKVAGEDDDGLQQTNRIINDQHIQERPMKKMAHPYAEADHVDPDVNFHQAKDPRKNIPRPEQYLREKKGNKIVLLIAFIVLIVAMAVLMLFALGQDDEKPSSVTSNNALQEGTYYTLEERSVLSENHGDIQVDSYRFDPDTETGYVAISNYGERAAHGNLALYKNDRMIATYDDLYILPYESFELTIYMKEPAEAYELQDYHFYEITTPEPDFSFYTYNDYGYVEVECYEDIDDEQLEVLLYYLQASFIYGEDSLSGLTVYLPNGNIYEAYIYSDGQVSIYYENSDYEVLHSYTLQLNENTTSKGISL